MDTCFFSTVLNEALLMLFHLQQSSGDYFFRNTKRSLNTLMIFALFVNLFAETVHQRADLRRGHSQKLCTIRARRAHCTTSEYINTRSKISYLLKYNMCHTLLILDFKTPLVTKERTWEHYVNDQFLYE